LASKERYQSLLEHSSLKLVMRATCLCLRCTAFLRDLSPHEEMI
jgi:hypothetical protein